MTALPVAASILIRGAGRSDSEVVEEAPIDRFDSNAAAAKVAALMDICANPREDFYGLACQDRAACPFRTIDSVAQHAKTRCPYAVDSATRLYRVTTRNRARLRT